MCTLIRKLDHDRPTFVPREKPLVGFRAWLLRDAPTRRLGPLAWSDDPRAWNPDEPFTTAGVHRQRQNPRAVYAFQKRTSYWARVRSVRPWGHEGLYAFRTPEICRRGAAVNEHDFLGIVFLWGDVVRYENGYRAQHAQVAQVFGEVDLGGAPMARWLKEQILEMRLTYGVQRLDAPLALPRTTEAALATI